MKLSQYKLRQVIREELAKGIPDYAFSLPTDRALRILADYFKEVLVAHINQTSKDASTRNKRYASANRVAASIISNQELKASIEEKLREKLLIFLDDSR